MAQKQKQQKPLKIAVVGVGHLGQHHARHYASLPECELVGIADTDASKKSIADEHKVPFTQDFHELIGKAEAISVAAPTSLHYEIAKDLLNAGIHILIEKPITDNLKQADELIQLAKSKKLCLQVGHIERFNAGFQEVKKIAEKLRFIEIHRLGPFTSRISDCGVVLDLMIHDLDIVLGLMDSPVSYIDAVGVNVVTSYEDIANVRLRFENGCVVNLTASRLTPEGQRKIRIFQENAYISLDYENQKAQIFTREDNDIHHQAIDIKKEEPLKKELQEFVDLVRSGKGIGKPDIAARNALELALRITEQIKKTSPKIPIDERFQALDANS